MDLGDWRVDRAKDERADQAKRSEASPDNRRSAPDMTIMSVPTRASYWLAQLMQRLAIEGVSQHMVWRLGGYAVLPS